MGEDYYEVLGISKSAILILSENIILILNQEVERVSFSLRFRLLTRR
jgi:hypothetical protein